MVPAVYIILTLFFRLFGIAVCFAHLYLFRNLYCGDAHRANYDKQSLNNYFRNGLHCAHHILSVLELFEIAVCFAHFRFFEICTDVMRTVLTIANRVKIIISNSVLKLFEIAVCFPHFSFF